MLPLSKKAQPRALHPTFGDRSHRFAADLKSVVNAYTKQQGHVLNYLVATIEAALRKRSAASLLALARKRAPSPWPENERPRPQRPKPSL